MVIALTWNAVIQKRLVQSGEGIGLRAAIKNWN